MNTTESLSETMVETDFHPGQYLAKERQNQGLSQEYIASKLHLRIKMVALIEADSYSELPQPVFVQGYLRAYAKLLGLDPKPILNSYSAKRTPETTHERILRQKSKEPVLTEVYRRAAIIAVMTLVLFAFYFLWNNHGSSKVAEQPIKTAVKETTEKVEQQALNLTDLSKMDPMNSNISESAQALAPSEA